MIPTNVILEKVKRERTQFSGCHGFLEPGENQEELRGLEGSKTILAHTTVILYICQNLYNCSRVNANGNYGS